MNGDVTRTDVNQLGFHATEANAAGGAITPAAFQVAISGTGYSSEVAVRVKTKLSVYVVITGTGSLKIELMGSPVQNSSAAPYVLLEQLTASQGSTTGKWYAVAATTPLSPFVKIKLTEVGGAATATATVYLVAQ